MRTWRIAELLEVSTGFLRERGSSSPRLDAELLLAEALGVGRIDLYTQYDRPLGAGEVDAYRALVARRGKREPVAYILGRASFRYLALKVTPATLIPRPETEELVDAVLEWLRVHPIVGVGAGRAEAAAAELREPGTGGDASGAVVSSADPAQPSPGPRTVDPADAVDPVGAADLADPAVGAALRPRQDAPVIVDVGTGSGAIALSLAQEAGVRVLGIDVSEAALRVAEENRAGLGLDSEVELRVGDLLEGVPPGSLRVVVANPPYVTEGERETLEPDVCDFEPGSALFAGVDGLDQIRRLVPQAAAALGPGGALLLEFGAGQAEHVEALVRAAGFGEVTVIPDLSGKDRIVRALLPGCPVIDASVLDETTLERLRAALRAGAVVGLPTDTVYGLAAAWDCSRGVARLFEAKGRDEERPVAVLFASVEQVRQSLPDLDPAVTSVLEDLLPGPYTFVVGTDVLRPRLVGTEDSLGVRVPDHAALLQLLDAIGIPLAATSANRSGRPDVAEAADVAPGLLTVCAAAFAGGAAAAGEASPGEEGSGRGMTSTHGVASTVVDLRPLATGGSALVLREGAVPAAEALRRVEAAQAGRAPHAGSRSAPTG